LDPLGSEIGIVVCLLSIQQVLGSQVLGSIDSMSFDIVKIAQALFLRFSEPKIMKRLMIAALCIFWAGSTQISLSADPRDVRRLKQTGECQKCNLVGANLRYANLRDANLKNANLKNADLTGANLQNTNLHHANLTYSSMKNAVIKDTDFSEANLLGATIDYRELDRGDAKICNAIMPNGVKKETNVEGFFGFGGCRH
jgi:Pentapeptide repeats (8 copies)